MTESTKLFNAGDWLGEMLQSLGSYRTIRSFITSQAALNAYLETVEIITGSEEGVEIIKGGDRAKVWHESIGLDVQKAEKFYNRQMVVLASTYVELVLKDFLLVIFYNIPSRMYQFLYSQDKQEKVGTVSFKEIVKANSLPLEDVDSRPFPIVVTAPVHHQALISLN
jgi:hypothetical protein